MFTVQDALKLPSLFEFRLVAGESGLNRQLREVNVLDFEYTDILEEPTTEDHLFHSGAMVLASLLYAREDSSRILPALKQLDLDGCCALAIKTVYYRELPSEVLQYADDHGISIFMFDNMDFENIIYEVFKAVYQENRIQQLEQTMNKVLSSERSMQEKLRLIHELIPELPSPYRCDFYKPRKDLDLLAYEHLMNQLWHYDSKGICYYPCRGGILLVADTQYSRHTHEGILPINNYYHGYSNNFVKYEDIPYAIQECISAADFAASHQLQDISFSKIGIMQILLPNRNNYWLDKFCNNILTQLKKSDKDGSKELYDTIRTYVEEGMDVNATAIRLSFHKNTVRYRLQKVCEILGYDEQNMEFNQAIYLAIMYEKLKI